MGDVAVGVGGTAHLPSWALAFRRKIEASRETYSVAERSLRHLEMNLADLTTRINSSLAEARQQGSSGSGAGGGAAGASGSTEFTPQPVVDVDRLGGGIVCLLPNEVLSVLLCYLCLPDVLRLEAASRSYRSSVSSAKYYWFGLYSQRVAGGSFASLQAVARQLVLNQSILASSCVAFIRRMKEQRAVPRTDNPSPHRYSKSERAVSHPLPLFSSIHAYYGSSAGTDASRSGSQELIMSMSETFSTDFRSYALRSLATLHELTSSSLPSDSSTLRRIADEGAVTVLVSLLSNELQIIQEFSCSILANLLHWENSRGGGGGAAEQTQLAVQLRLCNGGKLLLGLLTSPSATVNLAGSSGGAGRQATSSIQGVSNKEGCRALVNLHCKRFSVPSSLAREQCPRGRDAFISELFLSDDHSRPWIFRYFYKSGGLKERVLAWLQFTADGYVRGRGSGADGPFVLRGRAVRDIAGHYFSLHKSYVRLSGDEDVETWARQGAWDEGAQQRAHVDYCAYFSFGQDAECAPAATAEEMQEEEEEGGGGLACCGDSGLGLFGVWETAAAATHFHLERGGVFRAVPVIV